MFSIYDIKDFIEILSLDFQLLKLFSRLLKYLHDEREEID